MSARSTNQQAVRSASGHPVPKGNDMTKSVLMFLIAVVVCIGNANAQVVVASKIDTEGGVLGQIILQLLDHAGIETRDRIQLGGTPIMREAIIAGEIDIYPEYTGNAAFFFNRADE